MKKISIFILMLFVFSISLFSLEYKYKPLKSAMLSVFIPGGGQFYNDKKLKALFVAGGEVGLILKLNYDLNKKRYFEEKFKESQSNLDYSKFQKYYEKKQSDIFWLGFYVILSATDAFVDAHLYNFNNEKKKINLLFSYKKIGVKYVF